MSFVSADQLERAKVLELTGVDRFSIADICK